MVPRDAHSRGYRDVNGPVCRGERPPGEDTRHFASWRLRVLRPRLADPPRDLLLDVWDPFTSGRIGDPFKLMIGTKTAVRCGEAHKTLFFNPLTNN